jgi:ribosomal protein S18 acetylase RimI-like enzyme
MPYPYWNRYFYDMTETIIRPAKPNNISELVQLVNSAYRGETSKRGWTTEADLLDGIRTDATALSKLINNEHGVMLVAKHANSEVIGCVSLQQQRDSIYLGMLTVSPLLQGAGIGKQLLKAAEEYAKKHNYGSITMTVISLRTELIAWYERHGYRTTGETRPFPSSDPAFGIPKADLEFVVMRKIIIT